MLAGIILSYNNKKLTDDIYKQLEPFAGKDFKLFVFDNGSILEQVSKYTTYRISENRRIAGGWNSAVMRVIAGCRADLLWLITNDVKLVKGNPLKFEKMFNDNYKAGLIHPALTENSPTGWPEMIRQGKHKMRMIWMADIIAPVIRKDLFVDVGGFDDRFSRGWGMDWKLAYQFYEMDKASYITEDIVIRHLLGGTYRSGKADESDAHRTANATEEAEKYLSEEYGRDWRDVIYVHNAQKMADLL